MNRVFTLVAVALLSVCAARAQNIPEVEIVDF
jgi:hypothetical protein